MREIKFRGKRQDNDEWIIGSLIWYSVSVFIQASEIVQSPWFQVDPETVGQFTGLLDRNGKEIYESDIVSYENNYPGGMTEPDEPHNDFALIEYNNAQACFIANAGCFGKNNREKGVYSVAQQMDEYGALEIIGNRFCNPELLETL